MDTATTGPASQPASQDLVGTSAGNQAGTRTETPPGLGLSAKAGAEPHQSAPVLHANARVERDRMRGIVLAAGPGQAMLLRPLGDRAVVDHVIAVMEDQVRPDAITVVVAVTETAVQDHLGTGFHYAHQERQLGPASAASAGLAALITAAPDQMVADPLVLVVSGDLPLVSAASLRGLVIRHLCQQADLTHLVAGGRDVGVYVARASIWEELLRGDTSGSLTRIAAGASDRFKVSSYQIVDPDEVRDINTPEDLADAADIQLKRLFAPRHAIETGEISFGTGGWRAKIGEGFTIHNVRRLSQTLANILIRTGQEAQGVVIGGDRRFLSRESAEAAAEVFAGNNVPVTLLPGDVPTPLVTFAAPYLGAAYGLVFTASHNPPQWNGLKVFRGDGSLPPTAQTDGYQAEANALTGEDIVSVDLDAARAAGLVQDRDLSNAYIDAIERIVDIPAIRKNPQRILVDPMYGTSQLTLGTILTDARCRVDFIHERHNPLFGGRSPAPDAAALTALIDLVRTGPYGLGLATDGDADRIAIVDQDGRFVSTNELLLLLFWYLHEVRGERGGVVRNIATTHLLDRLARHFGETAREVPVGFKHITKGMLEDGALLGGESSGGLTIRGHILGKDGIFACALVVEMLARTGRPLAGLLEDIYAITGRMEAAEAGIPATPDMRIAVPRRMEASPPAQLAGLAVERIDTSDGFKFHLEGDAWGLLRFSGTEPVLRMFAEATTAVQAQAIILSLEELAKSTGPIEKA